MANRLPFVGLIRRVKYEFGATRVWRHIYSKSSPTNVIAQPGIGKNELVREIFRLKSPKRSVIALLQNRFEQGHKLSVSELRRISRQLLNSKRYEHALEILTWMETRDGVRMSPADCAVKLELIIKVYGLREGEEYFMRLAGSASKKAACFPLLHGYVKERDTEKAEALMVKLSGMGLIVTTHPFNEMMKLYMATSQCEKVPLVIQQMKRNNVPRNVLSYNLWMSACGEVSEVASAEMVYKEMVSDNNVQVGWSSLSTLANVYINAGLADKATLVLKNAENKLSTCNRLGYFFLITMYASLNNKEGVLRLWEGSKAVGGRITCANYMCVMSCLVKLGDLVEAERIFMEWESSCRNYDIRVSNVLLGAYMRNGMTERAESLHLHTLERGGCPNYKTWEILMEGWVKSQNMDKAINAMKKGFAMLKHCDWRPSHGILMAVAEYLEKHGNFEDANWYIGFIHRFGLASLPLYKSLLRMHLHAKRPAFDILKMMEKDKIEMDNETSALVLASNV
ncbi:pentatricopeptide repeat-containing protein At5g27460 [Fagus crenata]